MSVQDVMMWPGHQFGLRSENNVDYGLRSSPMLNLEGQVLGMITDRDIFMACATKNRATSELTVRDTVSGDTYRCKMSEDVHRR
jgi:hypothetical protein